MKLHGGYCLVNGVRHLTTCHRPLKTDCHRLLETSGSGERCLTRRLPFIGDRRFIAISIRRAAAVKAAQQQRSRSEQQRAYSRGPIDQPNNSWRRGRLSPDRA